MNGSGVHTIMWLLLALTGSAVVAIVTGLVTLAIGASTLVAFTGGSGAFVAVCSLAFTAIGLMKQSAKA